MKLMMSQLVKCIYTKSVLQDFNHSLPDNGGCNNMIGAAFDLGHAVVEVTGDGSQSPARQIRQQAHGNFVGADNLERKGSIRGVLPVKLFKKGRFKAGKVDYNRTNWHLIFGIDLFNIVDQLLPDDARRTAGSNYLIG